MQKIKKLFDNKWTPILLLLALAFVSHLQWFNPFSVLTHGDWGYWNIVASKELIPGWTPWLSFNNLGSVNIQIAFYVFNAAWAILGHLNIGYELAPKLTLMIPLAVLGFIAPYVYGLKIFRDRWVAFLAALFYGTTTYFLARQTGQIPITLIYALTPLLFYLFESAFEKQTRIAWLQFTLAYWAASFFEIRITFIVTGLLILHALFFNVSKLKGNVLNIIGAGTAFIGLSLFWALPTVLGGAGEDIQRVANRGLFGDSLFDLKHALALMDSAWTGLAPNELFISQPVKAYLWFFPLLAFLGALLVLKQRRDHILVRYTLFFLIISLVGIFITKQSSEPLRGSYLYMYSHVPGFNLFREASKFYVLTAFGYFGLIGVSLIAIKNIKIGANVKPYVYYGVATVLIALSLVNIKPLITQQIQTLFIASHMPQNYKELEAKISNDTNYYRTLWLPSASRWGFFSLLHPKLDVVGTVESSWGSLRPKYADQTPRIQAVAFLRSPIGEKIVQSAAVKYLIIPLRDEANFDDLFKFYGDDRGFFVDALNSISWLSKQTGEMANLDLFEVKNQRPYIDSATSLYNFQAYDDPNRVYEFINDNISKSPDFILGNEVKKPANITTVEDIFGELSPKDIKSNEIASTKTTSASTTLKIDDGKPSYDLQIQANRIVLSVQEGGQISLDGQLYGEPSRSTTLPGIQLTARRQYFLSVGTKLYPVGKENSMRNIGQTNESVGISSSDGINLISNSSLDEGFWQSDVQDCNAYDGKKNIGQIIKNEQRNKYLQLWSLNHTACTGPDAISVKSGQDYALNFRYKTDHVKEGGYELRFNDAKRTIVKKNIPTNNEDWHTYAGKISIPQGANSLEVRLLGLPNTDTHLRATTSYDDISLMAVRNELTAPKIETKTPQEFKLPSSTEKRISIADNIISHNNLIPNPSLEDGPWKKTVGDCNAYDGNPKISMSSDLKNSSDEKKSLKLSASRHTACTGPPEISVQEGGSYLFSFDYKGTAGTQSEYYIGFNDPDHTSLSEQLPIRGSDWKSFTRNIQVPIGATKLTLTVYGFSSDYGSETIDTWYDNFSIYRTPSLTGKYYLTSSGSGPVLARPESITFGSSGPTRKTISVKAAKSSFYLVMAETYNANWRLEMNNIKSNTWLTSWLPWAKPDAIPDSDHFKLNDFENGWYLDVDTLCKQQNLCHKNADGSYDMELIAEFTPQRWFYVGLIMSGATLAGCIGYLVRYGVRRRRLKRPTDHPRRRGRARRMIEKLLP